MRRPHRWTPAASIAAATLAAWLGPPSRTARASGCEVHGVVTDARGEPVQGVRLQLDEGSRQRTTASDRQGRYRFVGASGSTLAVSLVLTDAAHETPWFALTYERRPIEITSDTFADDGDCQRDFGGAAPDPRYPEGTFPKRWWPDAVTLYRGFAEALTLAESMPITTGAQPLQIRAFYPAASPDTSFWVGTPSYAPDATRAPFIGLGVHASALADDSWPSNREDHEIGHHVLARLLDGVHPRGRNDTHLGGYWTNPTSADAWAEGFATFYAIMVAKHVRKDRGASLVRVGGATVDLEADYRPWDLGGFEALAVAGLLLDLEDGPTDYARGVVPGLEVRDVAVWPQGEAVLVTGVVSGPTRNLATLDLALFDAAGTRVGSTRAAVLATSDDEPATFLTAIDPALQATTAQLGEVAPRDDDPLDIELPALWPALASFTSTKPDANGRLFDVQDLHAALSKQFGGTDNDKDGVDDIDQLFIAHGLFGDNNGNRRHDPGEPVGQTGHPAPPALLDDPATTRPAIAPRYRLALPPSLRASVAIEGGESDLVVVARAAGRLSVPYQPGADVDGRIALAIPPATPGSTLTVLASAKGKPALVVEHADAVGLLARVEQHGAPFITLAADLGAADSLEVPNAVGDSRVAWGLFAGGATSFVLGALVVLVGFVRRR